ncbi:hypothetical protein M0R45_037102 [Rubus argutus]|uniref:Uncharacterized protein n=1 Tax=Rubus argutus TaxID=59490 RepID=A0AAW1VZR2_RUBAR
MVAQLHSDFGLEENPDHQFYGQENDPYEAEETLSLCDLPTHVKGTQPQHTHLGTKTSSFLGNSFPTTKKHHMLLRAAEKKTLKNTETSNKSSTKKWRFFRWRRFRRSKSKVVLNCSKQSQVKGDNSTTNNISFPTAKSYKRCDLSLGKVSKSKWYLFMTGMVRFPTEMELRDIKSRPNRRSPSTMFGDNCKASNELMGKGNKEISSSNGNSRAKGLWGAVES